MRITTAEKAATRERIVDAALDLFRASGFTSTTTRDIAQAAEIATGTLFNYFASKEAIVLDLAHKALETAWAEYDQRERSVDLRENLFALVAAEIRRLKPLRLFLSPMLKDSLSPLTSERENGGDLLRTNHLKQVSSLILEHLHRDPKPTELQVYWTLYAGMLAFWAADDSRKQEQTLALLDQLLTMFVAWLQSAGAAT